MASEIGFTIESEMPDVNTLASISADIPLNDIAERCVQDIKGNIRRGVTWNGKRYKGLSEKTRDEKRKKGYSQPDTALFRTGLLFKAVRKYKLRKNLHMVGVSPVGKPDREWLADIHQLKGVNKHTRVIRAFFGISSKRVRWARSRMNRWFKSVINKAYLHKVREKRSY